ncbi:Mur ligase family protein [Staphylococcus pseudoxylosus]|uniref:Mur ligase family protein n=1 Tax=Staphylococcus pseudoxylosus TaxID=2282419 RepID=UPI002DB7A282|nr:Mur ligase family protein [Staphylococcus pseudoxylosus]MEB6061005.1 Mur ligase family protein [Staphylococcus pseudoxylosus]
MKITIKDILSVIERNTVESSKCVKLDSEVVCEKVTSMYQDISQSTLFMLKDSDNVTYYAQCACKMNPLLVVTDANPSKFSHFEYNLPIIFITDFPEVANNLVKLFYKRAIEHMNFIAVTGTNGKTTTSHMIGNLLTKLDKKVAIIGTMGVYDCNYNKLNFNHSTQTTPMYFEMAEIINYFYNENYDYIVYEATSIALEQRRTDFIKNDLAVFTNFSPEHLEYHGTMTNYLNAKLRLNSLSSLNLVNLDTVEYRTILKDEQHFSSTQDAYYQYHIGNDTIGIEINDDAFTITPTFKGGHNFINLATSIFALDKLGFDSKEIVKVASIIDPPLHRFQIIEIDAYTIILDFAHTALAIKESINNALNYSKSINKSLNTMVTGIGLRGLDKIKLTVDTLPKGIHKLMIAAEQVGYEDPEKILRFMFNHLPDCYKTSNILRGSSRKEGIKSLLQATDKNNEIILLTGINEPQNYRGKKYDHDDQEYAKKILQELKT